MPAGSLRRARARTGRYDAVRMRAGRSVAVTRGRLAPLTRLGWGVADQGISSVGNFAFSIIVAKALSPSDFGAFAIAFVTYGMILYP